MCTRRKSETVVDVERTKTHQPQIVMCELQQSQTGGGSMKRHALSIVSLLSLVLMGSAVAQTIQVRSDVPFSFSVGSTALPAGAYDITSISPNSHTLLVKARDGSASMIVNSNAAVRMDGAEKTKLVFNRYGSQYFLAEIWREGSTSGNQLPKSSREKELAKELAMGHADRVVIVARLY